MASRFCCNRARRLADQGYHEIRCRWCNQVICIHCTESHVLDQDLCTACWLGGGEEDEEDDESDNEQYLLDQQMFAAFVAWLNKTRVCEIPVDYRTVDDEQECGVCLGNIAAGKTAATAGCVHNFHVECLTEWFRVNPSCPTCRVKKAT